VTPQSSFSDRDEITINEKLVFDQELLTTATAAASAVAKRDYDRLSAESIPKQDYKHDPTPASTLDAANAIIEPLDHFFAAEQNMFDEEVDESFFDPDYCTNLPDIIDLSSSSCSSSSEEPLLGPWSVESSREKDDLDGIMLDVMLDTSYVG